MVDTRPQSIQRKERQDFIDDVAKALFVKWASDINTPINDMFDASGAYEAAEALWEERQKRIAKEGQSDS